MIATFVTDLSTVTFDNVAKIKEEVLHERPLPGDDRLWILGQDLEVRFTRGVASTIVVKKGFVTDGASVPWLAQLLTGWHPWDPPQRWGAIVHDWCYCLNGTPAAGGNRCGKPYADLAFRAALRAAGANVVRAQTMYLAVHLFGAHAYEADQARGPEIWP